MSRMRLLRTASSRSQPGLLSSRCFRGSSWLRFLAEEPATRSCTSIQLAITDPWFQSLSDDARFKTVRSMTARLEAEGAGYDLASHRASPPGIRIWAGATAEQSDVEALLPWLDWAWEQERDAAKAA